MRPPVQLSRIGISAQFSLLSPARRRDRTDSTVEVNSTVGAIVAADDQEDDPNREDARDDTYDRSGREARNGKR